MNVLFYWRDARCLDRCFKYFLFFLIQKWINIFVWKIRSPTVQFRSNQFWWATIQGWQYAIDLEDVTFCSGIKCDYRCVSSLRLSIVSNDLDNRLNWWTASVRATHFILVDEFHCKVISILHTKRITQFHRKSAQLKCVPHMFISKTHFHQLTQLSSTWGKHAIAFYKHYRGLRNYRN